MTAPFTQPSHELPRQDTGTHHTEISVEREQRGGEGRGKNTETPISTDEPCWLTKTLSTLPQIICYYYDVAN